MRVVNLAAGERLKQVWTQDFVAELDRRCELTLGDNTAATPDPEIAAIVRGHDVAIVGWDARALPAGLADDPGALSYVCCYSGTIGAIVPRELVAAGIPVSNWGDLPADGVATAAMSLLLAMLHDFGAAVEATRAGRWGYDGRRIGQTQDLAVGVYGAGVIGGRFIEMLRPFGARIRVFDPYAGDLPDDCEPVGSLDELCEWAEVLVIHNGLTDETRGAVTAERLASLPDGAIVINTARGAIIDQNALFAELKAGRLRAGLDVLEPDELEAGHPIRQLPNVLFTFHQAGGGTWPSRPGLSGMQRRVLDQLDRFAAGDEPLYLFDLPRYDRST